MNPVSIVALVVAFIVLVVGLARAAAARKALDEVRAELDKAKRAVDEVRAELGEANSELEEARKKLRALEAAAKAAEKEAEKKEAEKKEAAEREAAEAAEKKAAEKRAAEKKAAEKKAAEKKPPKVDLVRKRADKILQDARNLARFVGFDNQIEIDGQKGVRVTVPMKDDLDKQAFEHLRANSDAVLDVGERNGERFLVVRA